MTLDIVLNNPQIRWNWTELSRNPSITAQDIFTHPELPWDEFIIQNPNITLQHMLAHPEIDWDWDRISDNPTITLNDVFAHPELEWRWTALSRCAAITIDDVRNHPDLPWDYGWLSRNTLCARVENKTRIIKRTRAYKEELMQVCWSPERLAKMLDNGYNLEDIE
jgi:hypothetical protein